MYQNGTLISGTKDYHLRNPGSLILSHTHMGVSCWLCWLFEAMFRGFQVKPEGCFRFLGGTLF